LSKPNPHKPRKSDDEDTPIGIDFTTYEYAIERTIVETPLLELTYYIDVVGDVPPVEYQHSSRLNNWDHSIRTSRGVGAGLEIDPNDPNDIGNGDVDPEWGIHLTIHSGLVRYGPWADRQRVEIQKCFFPQNFSDATPHRRLEVGDKRVWTTLQVFVELRDETVLHVPFREPSENWQWDGEVEIPDRPKKREHAWMHITAGDRSSISYVMPIVANQQGYDPVLEVHLDTVVVTSSLNDIPLISAESCRVHCELPSPLKWNGERTWQIGVTLRQPVLYLLRDHINMFTDLSKDWSSGPPSNWEKWIPMIYKIQVDLHHFRCMLYANDHNIIDKPMVRDENGKRILTCLLISIYWFL
jgi:hypothetical protein